MTKEDIEQTMAIISQMGDSCDTCTYCGISDGDCPFEPYNREDKPNVNGALLCFRHSNGPAPGTGGRGTPGRVEGGVGKITLDLENGYSE